ncbi:nitrate/nitrite transporter NrtS [Pseudocolwellia sp. HL-MZ19]|uniref:nitrate/nitrite transporter NrtS n=1 Tax=unclassified Pseudocolwellia TaxID=2848178 RepID=UPI003CF7A8B4
MSEQSTTFIALALSKKVVSSALKVALIVGTILAVINHGSTLLEMDLSGEKIAQILLTYLVPYCVSTYSSVKAIQGHQKQN